jgi:hypothetical protein
MLDCRALMIALTLTFAASPVLAAPAYTCDGTIMAKTTLADLEKAYGKKNVKTGQVDGPEGTTMIATTVFPKDEKKTFEVYWFDEQKHEGLAGYTIAQDGVGPGGLKLGMAIKDVETINGGPFTLSGFYWDYGGGANFSEGKLSDVGDDCYVGVTFAPSVDPTDEKVSTAISGEQELKSNMKEFDIVKPVVQSINISFSDPNEGDDESPPESGDTAQ